MKEQNSNTGSDKGLPFVLPVEQWGEIAEASEECPGVYYVATQNGDCGAGREMYAAMKNAIPSIISAETASYGTQVENAILFEYGVEGSGWPLARFEIMRYKKKNGIPEEDGDTLYSSAAFAADVYPDYFGGYIPPRMTPWGVVIRVKRAEEGIFFLETINCEWVLAVAYIIWESELSEAARKYGVLCDYDTMLGEQEAKYLYFRRDKCAAALYELTCFGNNPKCKAYIVSHEVLETQIYQQNPEYAIWHNRWELEGYGMKNMLWCLLTEMCEAPRQKRQIGFRSALNLLQSW